MRLASALLSLLIGSFPLCEAQAQAQQTYDAAADRKDARSNHEEERNIEDQKNEEGRATYKGRSSENAVRAAEDAFGTTIGHEAIGLYRADSVRGYSPTVAGNIRIGGLYFDQQGGLTSRIKSGSTIRVGIASQTDPFPAPTGIVDIKLRQSSNYDALSAIASTGPYRSLALELDGQVSIIPNRLSAAVGAAAFRDRFGNGGSGKATSLGIVPRLHATNEIDVIAFWGRANSYDETASSTYIPRDAKLPPRIDRRSYDGPSWALSNGFADNAGLIARGAFGAWTLNMGLFRSLNVSKSSYAYILNSITQQGSAQREIFANPSSQYRSYSGEFRVSRALREGPRQHLVLASLRLRDVRSRFGGSDLVNFGFAQLGAAISPQKPEFKFGEQTIDTIDQFTLGLSYSLKWDSFFELRAGIQRTKYKKNIDEPNVGLNTRESMEWLPNFTASIQVVPTILAYGSYSKGLEENGQAPEFAINRLQILPALSTRQFDVGLKWSRMRSVSLIFGYFNIRKPYFSVDESNIYRKLGVETHEGFEISLASQPVEGLRVVGGAIVQRATVTNDEVAAEVVGKHPVAQPGTTVQLNADYVLPFLKGTSIDFSLSHKGRQAADVHNAFFVPAYTTLDIGARYTFRLDRAPASLRLSASNFMNKYVWLPIGSGAFEPLDPRSFSAYIAVDF
jgi:iron complex outermembrane receptor protein